MKFKDQQLLEEAYNQIYLKENQNEQLFDVIEKGGDGTQENPFKSRIWVDIYLLASVLRDYAQQTGKTYFFEHNGILYKATGENKLIKA